MKLNLKIDGMGCEHCIKSVREALEEIKNKKEEMLEYVKEKYIKK